MVQVFLTLLAALSIFASVVSVYILIIASFEKREKKKEKPKQQFIKRESRTIVVNHTKNETKEEKEGVNTQVTSLLSTVVIGQAVGLYFLFVFLSGTKGYYSVLKFNGVFLLLASFLCSILTMLNGWLKKKMEISFRLIFQGYSFIVAIVLCRIAFNGKLNVQQAISKAGPILNYIVIVSFSTVIVALGLMFLDGIYRKQQRLDYNFNIYYLIVVITGMGIGLGLLSVVSMIARS